MQVQEVMSAQPDYLEANATIKQAARQMREKNRGFAPIAENNKLIGILTDRDLAMRALTNGYNPDEPVKSVLSDRVLYCFRDDDIEQVLQNMQEQRVQRLIVLDNKDDKNMVGVITLGDIADKCSDTLGLAGEIVKCCRHYH